MGDFKRGGNRFGGDRRGGGFGGGRPSFGGNRGGFRGNDRGPVTMHKVICDECKKPCEVPFKPTAGKPVYCNACFGGKRPVRPSGAGGEGGNDRGGRPSFGGNDYRTPPRTDFGNDIKKVSGEEIKKQIEVLNVKIDRLAKLIEEMKTAKMTESEVKDNPPTLKSSGEAKKKVAKKVSKRK
jgi:DNA-directed RNA polymerase